MIETKRKKTITERWREDPFNAIVINLAGSYYQESGLPDTLLIKDRLHVWIEFKSKDRSIDPKQEACHKKFLLEGLHVFVVRFIDDSLWIIDDKYEIKMKQLRFGVKLLYDTLITLAQSNQKKEGGLYVPQNITSVISTMGGQECNT